MDIFEDIIQRIYEEQDSADQVADSLRDTPGMAEGEQCHLSR